MVWSQRAARVCLPMIAFCLLIFGWWLVTNEDAYAGYDTTAPKLNEVTFNRSIIKPGMLKVTLDITEEETGVSGCSVGMEKTPSGGYYVYYSGIISDKPEDNAWGTSPKFSGKYSVYVTVPSSVKSGDYSLSSIELVDMAGNRSNYYWDYIDYGGGVTESLFRSDGYEAALINGKTYGAHTVAIKDEFDVDFQTYVTNSTTTAKIKAMPEGQAGMILFSSGNHIAKKEWFDAIKGKDKTLVFSNDGTQWVFNGKDIINPTKDIDLFVKFKRAAGDKYDVPHAVMEIEFAENGLLPGKARIRLKADYLSSIMGLNTQAYLFYLNGYQASLESSNVNSLADGSAYWCEFYVTHNSDYVVSKNKFKNSVTTAGGTVSIISSKQKTAMFVKAKNKKNVVVPATAKINGKTYEVTKVSENAFKGKKIRTVTIGKNVKVMKKNAFKGSKATKLIVKSKKLCDAKGSLKGSRIKTVKVKVGSKKANKKYVIKYKWLFRKSYSGKKVRVK